MTEGIIQKAFKKYYSHMHSFNGYTNFNSTEVITLYDQLMTELIEEIKKKQTRFGLLTSIPIKDLIGDSE